MKMLREWNGDSNELIYEMLNDFGISASKITLIKYEALTPDSFIWVLNADGKRLCLYAEDYVPSLDHVKEVMNKFGIMTDEEDKYSLLPVKEPSDFEESNPVTSSDIYNPPEKMDEFMKYAAPSGYDFAFLGQSTID